MQDNRYLIPFLGIITLVMVGFVLKVAQSVVLPLILAWLLSYLLAPVVKFLARHRVPTGPAVLVVLFLLFGFLYLTGQFVFSRAQAFMAESSRYASQLNQITTSLTEGASLPAWFSLEEINWQKWVATSVTKLTGSVASFGGNLFLVIIFLVFMLLGKPYGKQKIQHAFPGERAEQLISVTSSITGQISRYLSIKLLVSAITAVLVWLVLFIMKVDFPVTWAVLTFLLNFIPTIGSVIATVPPVLVALVQFYPGFWPCIIVLLLLLLIQQTMGSFIEPKIMGENLNLSPVVILLSLVFFGWLWGITGALLSTPIAAAIKIVCENIEALKPISVLMGGGKNLPREA